MQRDDQLEIPAKMPGNRYRPFWLFFVLICVCGSLNNPLSAQSRLDTIVSGGDVANGDGNFASFYSVNLNNAGQVSFNSRLSGTSGGTSPFKQSVYFYDGTVLNELARQESSAPNNGNFGQFRSNQLNDLGQVAFDIFSMTGTSGGLLDDTGVFLYDGSVVSEIAREGSPAPVSGNFGRVSLPSNRIAFSHAGHIGFQSDASGGSQGAYLFNGTSNIEIARQGNSAPNGGSFFNPIVHSVNDLGQVTVHDTISGKQAIFFHNGSGLAEIARQGNAAPGGGMYGRLAALGLNNSGQIALSSFLMTGGPSHGVFLYDGTNVIDIVRSGDAAPSNGNFGPVGVFGFNELGHIAINTNSMTGTTGGTTDDAGLYVYNGTSIIEMVRKGNAAPGNGFFGDFSERSLNNSGQITFSSQNMTGTSGGTADDKGFFITDGIDTLEIVREGDLVNGFPATAINGLQLNDLGQATYTIIRGAASEIRLWTPDLHWRSGASGNWDDAGEWTLGLNPAHVHNTFIDPASNLTVQGPTSNTTVRDFQLGGGAGAPVLNWNPGVELTANQIAIESGTLTGGGIFNANTVSVAAAGNIESQFESMTFNTPVMTNNGTVNFDEAFMVVNGNLQNSSTGQMNYINESSLNVTGDMDNQGVLHLLSSDATVGGRYSGEGDFTGTGILNINGVLAPGNSVASILMDGELYLDPATVSEFELGGEIVGEFDQIYGMDVFGIDGELQVSLVSGFQLASGMEFIIADVEGFAFGEFNGLNEGGLVGNFGGENLFISYSAGTGNDVSLYTVPEPTTAGLSCLLVMAVVTFRRKRRI